MAAVGDRTADRGHDHGHSGIAPAGAPPLLPAKVNPVVPRPPPSSASSSRRRPPKSRSHGAAVVLF